MINLHRTPFVRFYPCSDTFYHIYAMKKSLFSVDKRDFFRTILIFPLSYGIKYLDIVFEVKVWISNGEMFTTLI